MAVSSTSSSGGSVQGVSSGIQWRDMVDAIMKAEEARTLTPVRTQISAADKAATTWSNFQGTMGTFRDAAKTLRDPVTFDAFTVSAGKSPTGNRDLISATAGAGAAPGSYSVEVLGLARAEKLSGGVMTNSSTAVGITGSFTLNGKMISVVASDTLATLRDKVNASNSGKTPSGVSAAILTSGNGARLVFTSAVTGSSGISTVDDAAGTLQSLGFIDSTTTANITPTGATQTYTLTSSTSNVSALLGLTMPAASTISAGGHPIAIDLSTDSLSTIADRINTATGNSAAATVQSETIDGKSVYRLVTDVAIAADGAVNLANSQRALASLGFTTPGHAGVAQTLKTANTFVDAFTSATATTATLLTDLKTGGGSLGVGNGDTLTIAGKRGDGVAVSRTFAVTGTTTVQGLLDAINAPVTGFGGGTRPATASFSGGRIVLTDGTTGDSQLAMSITDATVGGNTISLGAISASNGGAIGRSRQISAGVDASVRVDGQVLRRPSNTITDASGGVTLNLLAAEVGTTVEVVVARDADKIIASITAFTTAYNNVRKFVTTNGAKGGSLEGSSALRSMSSVLTSELLKTPIGLGGPFSNAAQGGLQHDKNGTLTIDGEKFKGYLAANFGDIKRLFTLTGTTTDSEAVFISAGDKTAASATPYAVNISTVATTAAATGSIWSTYATAGAPDTVSVTDVATGLAGTIQLANGDGIDTAVQRLNGLFGAKNMRLTATKTGDSRLKIAASDYGTTGGFTIAYTPGAGGDGTAALGLTAQAYAGLDVAGTINGAAATGRGQFLTGVAGNASEGLIIQFSGTTARAAGTVSLTLGVGGALTRVAAGLTADNSGAVATLVTTEQTRSATLSARINGINTRLDTHRQALLKKFSAMETAMSKITAMGSVLNFPR